MQIYANLHCSAKEWGMGCSIVSALPLSRVQIGCASYFPDSPSLGPCQSIMWGPLPVPNDLCTPIPPKVWAEERSLARTLPEPLYCEQEEAQGRV